MTGSLASLVIRRAAGKVRKTIRVRLPGQRHTLARVFRTDPASRTSRLPGGAEMTTGERRRRDQEEIQRDTILGLDLQSVKGPAEIDFAVEVEFDNDHSSSGTGTVTAQVTAQVVDLATGQIADAVPPSTREFSFRGGVADDAVRLGFEAISSEKPDFDRPEAA